MVLFNICNVKFSLDLMVLLPVFYTVKLNAESDTI